LIEKDAQNCISHQQHAENSENFIKKKKSIENVCNWNTEIEVKNHLEEFIVQ